MRKLIIFSIVFLLFTDISFAGGKRKKVVEGNKLYTEKKYDEALNKYRDALLDDPESPEIHYNIGNVYYHKKKYQEALKEYNKVLSSKDPELQFKSYYNIGNVLYRMGKLPESILSYKKALQLKPNDMDAKYNIEFVRNKLKELAKRQPQSSQQQQKVGKQKNQQNQGDKKDQNNKDKKQKQKKSTGDKNQNKEQKYQKGKANKKKEMTKEEAERILNALKNDEKNIQKKRLKRSGGKVTVSKDW